MNGEKTVKCPICGRPYKIYSHYAGDQSACPKCRAEAERNIGGGNYPPIYGQPMAYAESDEQRKIREDINRRHWMVMQAYCYDRPE